MALDAETKIESQTITFDICNDRITYALLRLNAAVRQIGEEKDIPTNALMHDFYMSGNGSSWRLNLAFAENRQIGGLLGQAVSVLNKESDISRGLSVSFFEATDGVLYSIHRAKFSVSKTDRRPVSKLFDGAYSTMKYRSPINFSTAGKKCSSVDQVVSDFCQAVLSMPAPQGMAKILDNLKRHEDVVKLIEAPNLLR